MKRTDHQERDHAWLRLAVLLVAIGVTALSRSEAQAISPEQRTAPAVARRLTVTGHGEVKVQPDQAEITIGVVTEDRSSKTAAHANAVALQQVQAAVKRLGIVPKDIQTVQYSVQPIYNAPPLRSDAMQRPPVITAYRVTNQARVTVHDIARLGDVVDAATAAGSNQIESIGFSKADQTASDNEALSKAVADARRKADQMARAAGVKIVGVYEMNEGNFQRPGPIMYSRASIASTPIEPGEASVTASVTIVYEIRDGAP